MNPRSARNLIGVHPDLVKVVTRAEELLPVLHPTAGFTVIEGVRTLETQKKYFAAGKSNTMKSRHLTGHAVDLMATVAGAPGWEEPLYFRLAAAMGMAARELNTAVEWGGCWRSVLSFPPTQDGAKDAWNAYVAGKRKLKQDAFTDGPHFQLPWDLYPA